MQQRLCSRFGKTFDWSLKAKVRLAGAPPELGAGHTAAACSRRVDTPQPTAPPLQIMGEALEAAPDPGGDLGLACPTANHCPPLRDSPCLRLHCLQMMGKKALEAAQTLVDELGLHGQITPEQFLAEREEALDSLFPTAQLLPGAGGCCAAALGCTWLHAQRQHAAARAGRGMDMPGCSCCSQPSCTRPPPRHCSLLPMRLLLAFTSLPTPMCIVPASAERLLRHLHTQGIPFCLATSSHLAHYSLKTTLHTDLFALFNHRVTGGWGGGCWLEVAGWLHCCGCICKLAARANANQPWLLDLLPSALPLPLAPAATRR